MKVLYVTHDTNLFGGANRALVECLESLDKNKYESIVLVNNKKGELISQLKKMGIKYIYYKYGWFAFHESNNKMRNKIRYYKLIIHQIFTKIFMRKLINNLNEIDIIHSNSSVINVGAIIANKLNKPHVWHIREFGEEHLRMRFLYGEKKSRMYMKKNSDRIILISKSLEKKYQNIIGNEKLQVIYDGVSFKYINYNKKRRGEKFNIIQVGNIQRGKRQIDLIKAVKELSNEGYKINFEIIGDIGEQDYYEKAIELSKEENNIEIIGPILDLKILNQYRERANCEIITSEMEAFGRVTIEGMLSCLPIIAANSGASSELIIDGFNGFKYKPRNIEELKEKIKLLIENEKLGTIMGENAFNYAKEKYLDKVNMKNIEKIYEEIYKKGKI